MASHLMTLKGNRLFNMTIFPPTLEIFEELLIYHKRTLLVIQEVTISYNQISQIALNKGIMFASLEIVTTGTDDIIVKFLSKSSAAKAKKIIDQKIYHSHAKHHEQGEEKTQTPVRVEKSLARLKELQNRGFIDEHEFEKRKRQMIKEL